MATTFISFDKTREQPASVCNALRSVRDGRNNLNADIAIFKTMITGDASTIDQFDLAVQTYGFGGWVASNAVTDAQRTLAQQSWNELNSLAAKLDEASGVGDSTGAAIDQACAKHGV